MSEGPRGGGGTTPRGNPTGETLRGEEVCDSFETAWLPAAAFPDRSFLVAVDGPAAARGDWWLDTQHRQRTGETVTGHYRERFPDLDRRWRTTPWRPGYAGLTPSQCGSRRGAPAGRNQPG